MNPIVKILVGAARGGAGGFVATIPMTLAMVAIDKSFKRLYDRPLPPKEITDKTIDVVADIVPEVPHPDEPTREALTTAAHFGFGSSAGAAYGAAVGRIPGPWYVKGVGYGLAVWAASYAGWLPAVGLQPKPKNQPRGRNVAMIGAHIVWGLTLAKVDSYGRPTKIRAKKS